jgi:hypothetical protein
VAVPQVDDARVLVQECLAHHGEVGKFSTSPWLAMRSFGFVAQKTVAFPLSLPPVLAWIASRGMARSLALTIPDLTDNGRERMPKWANRAVPWTHEHCISTTTG